VPLNEIIWGVAIVLLAGIIQGCTGFAFALITVPVLMLFMPHTEVPPLIVMLSFVNNLLILYDARQFVRLRMVFPLWVGGFIGLPIGGYILKTIDPVSFKITVGVIVLALSIVMLIGWRRKVKNEAAGLVPVGFISGVLSSGTSIAGPPVILFFSNQGVKREVFRANLVAYFAFINIGAAIVFALYGLLNHAVMVRTGAYIAPAIIGSLAGIWLSRFINEKLFGKLVLILVCVLALVLVIRNIPSG
jgi:uncharacterized membrane protein YfcA